MTDTNQSPTHPVRVEQVENLTPEMHAAWVEYEPPERFASAIEHPFAVACVRDAFYAGMIAARQSGIDAGLAMGAEIARGHADQCDDTAIGRRINGTANDIATAILAARIERGEDNPNGR